MECPICNDLDAQEMERDFSDERALKCPTHGEFQFTDTVRATRMNEPREAWERAHTRAIVRAVKESGTLGGKRPQITDYDF